MKVYYIGKSLNDSGDIWSIEGIFSTLKIAVENVANLEYIVELELDKKLPEELHQPEVYWWCINGQFTNNKDEVVTL